MIELVEYPRDIAKGKMIWSTQFLFLNIEIFIFPSLVLSSLNVNLLHSIFVIGKYRNIIDPYLCNGEAAQKLSPTIVDICCRAFQSMTKLNWFRNYFLFLVCVFLAVTFPMIPFSICFDGDSTNASKKWTTLQIYSNSIYTERVFIDFTG